MKKFITDECTGLRYELVGDYYLIAGDDEPKEEHCPIGIWGQRHLQYIKQYRKSLYVELKMSGRLNGYLADLNKEAEEMFSRMIKQLSEQQGITERLKVDDQLAWVGLMNNIRACAMEIVSSELIYA